MTDLQFALEILDRGAMLSALRAFKKGDFSVRMPMDLTGSDGEIAQAFNDVVEMNERIADEFARIREQVGKEGQIGQRVRLPAAVGSWAEGVDSVNALIGDLVRPTSEVARVIESVAKGDLSQRMQLEIDGTPLRGEFLRIGRVVNTMVDQLDGFASEVSRVAREVGSEGKLGGQAQVKGVAGTWKGLTDNVNQLAANLTNQVRTIAEVATAVAKGDLTRSIMVEAMGEVAALKDNINEMIRNLKDTTLKNNEQDWLKTNLAKFSRMLQGHGDLVAVSKLVLSELAPLVNAQQGVLYTPSKRGNDARLELLASYASRPNRHLAKTLRIGEGLVGQCAFEKKRILLEEVPHDYVRFGSVLGSAAPLNVIILPVLFEGEVKAVLELASIRKFSQAHLSFLDQLAEGIGIVFNTIEANMRTADLLQQSQTLTRELQSQQEELQRANDELQEKAKQLSEQMRQVELKNREVELAKAALEEKAEQLALSSCYKSEFLANMSHELRTPLNSLLILAKLLADNVDNTLTPKQIDYAQTIYASGADLLSLINDILDLAKIESGTVTLDIRPLRLSELRDYFERTFRQGALDKNLAFDVDVDPSLAAVIHTDEKRLQQILKNLLSNAFKFTEKGKVALRIFAAKSGWSRDGLQLEPSDTVVAFAVADTGIGIPENKQKVIFEAFQQADGTTSRQYGGTGLGLSISRELTRLLGGEIRVESEPGRGSTFVLYLRVPSQPAEPESEQPAAFSAESPFIQSIPRRARLAGYPRAERRSRPPAEIEDDRDEIHPGDRVLLIVEDDAKFARTLLQIARASGFKGVVALSGTTALTLARDLQPDAITLDLKLPEVDGWVVLDLLKHSADTRHIPVSVISVDDRMHKCLHMGAIGIVQKSAARETLQEALMKTRKLIERDVRTLLVVDGDAARRAGIIEALGGEAVRITTAGTGKQALAELRDHPFDCVVLGPRLMDMTAIALLKTVAECETVTQMPFVIYETEDLEGAEQDDLRKLAGIVVLKKAPTPEAVLEETALFLHQALSSLPAEKREMLASRRADPRLAGRKALIVDDDVRNLFALAGALEQCGMSVFSAENGKESIEVLKNTPGIDVVLMDIMMPELDGYDTIRIIRGQERFKDLPIIAVTAKAMKEDREKCIEVGASDYIAKPVNVEQLMSLMRIWLSR